MKRISILVVLALLAPTVSQAHGHGSQRNRIRYSPYAFNYHNSGLVPAGVKYSPYAFTPSHSGLVFQGARYSPYAFNYHNSGLVVDHHCGRAPVCRPCPSHATTRSVAPRPTKRSSSRWATARRSSVRVPVISAAERRQIRETDGMHVIRRYLKERGFGDIEINRRLSVESRTASVTFLLRDKNLIVRYTDPGIVEALATKGGAGQKAFERAEARWETLAQTFQAKGGNIYKVNVTDKEQIVAALDNCDALASENTTMYAKN